MSDLTPTPVLLAIIQNKINNGVDKTSNVAKVKEALEPVLDFITDTCVDYYEFERYIL